VPAFGPPDRWGEKLGAPIVSLTLRLSRAGFEPFRGRGRALVGRRCDAWVRHYSWVDTSSTARLKTGADERESKSNLRRAEFFAPPIRGADAPRASLLPIRLLR
jgi:hypothetical protein